MHCGKRWSDSARLRAYIIAARLRARAADLLGVDHSLKQQNVGQFADECVPP